MPEAGDAHPRIVLALDLSKTSTGYSVACQHPGGEISYLATGVIKPPDGVRLTRWYFPVIDYIDAELTRALAGFAWFATRRFSVAVEAPVLKLSQSEETFFIFQNVIRVLAGWQVDVVTYSNVTIKGFALKFTPRPRESFSQRLQKYEMEDIWRNDLRPQNEAAFPSLLLAADDVVDAAWLALLALHAQAHILPEPYQPGPDTTPMPLWSASVGDFYRARFLKLRLNHLAHVPTPDLSSLFTLMRGNKHLSFAAGSYFPFRALDNLAIYAEWARDQDAAQTEAHLLGRMGGKTTRRALHAALDQPHLHFTLDDSGTLRLIP